MIGRKVFFDLNPSGVFVLGFHTILVCKSQKGDSNIRASISAHGTRIDD